MARLPYLERDDLPPEARHVYDEIAGSRGSVAPNFKVLLNSPEATSRLAALGAYVRFETPLSPRTKALAVLTAARECDGDYVWTMNDRQARSSGVDEGIIDAIRERRAPEGLEAEDSTIVAFTLELLKDHRVSDATFQAVHRSLGDSGVVDLIILIGYYFGLSHALSALEVDLEEGLTSTLSG